MNKSKIFLPFYTKYRPKQLSEVVGQQHIVRTLETILGGEGQFHAYLFYGSHGVGKTSVARIFACSLSYKDDPVAARRCAGAIDSEVDIFELDAASNSGVEEIRRLILNVNNLPLVNKLKIFIIDEIHMLSKSAFNALLKLVEQPPNYIVFIFATTEINKVPLTLLSRVQRHVFTRLSDEDISKQLERVLKEENVEYEGDVLGLIVANSSGSMRDSLTLLEQLISYSGGLKLTRSRANELLGLLDNKTIIQLINSISLGETAKTSVLINNLSDSTTSFDSLFNPLILALRDIVLSLLITTEGEFKGKLLNNEELKEIKIDLPKARKLIEILLKTKSESYGSLVGKQILEMRLVNPLEDTLKTEGVEAKNKSLEETSFFKEKVEAATKNKISSSNNLEDLAATEGEAKLVDDGKKVQQTRMVEVRESVKGRGNKSSLKNTGGTRRKKDVNGFIELDDEQRLEGEGDTIDPTNLTEIISNESRVINHSELVKITKQIKDVVKKQEVEKGITKVRGDLGGAGQHNDLKKSKKGVSALDLDNVAFHGKDLSKDTFKRWNQIDKLNKNEDDLKMNFLDFTERGVQQSLLNSKKEPDSSSKLTTAELLNLLLLSSIDGSHYLKEYQERIAIMPTYLQRLNRDYFQLLKDIYILRTSRTFILAGSDNPDSITTLNKNREKDSFLEFVKLIFGRKLYIFGTTELHLVAVEERLSKLRRENALPKAKPLKPLDPD